MFMAQTDLTMPEAQRVGGPTRSSERGEKEKADMNKPAAKEPSMDEILSSIRQIIADDDDRAGKPEDSAPPEQIEEDDEGLALDFALDEDDEPVSEPEEEAADEPLELSAAQIVEDPAELDMGDVDLGDMADMVMDASAEESDEEPAAPATDVDFGTEMVVPDDIAFEGAEPEPEVEEVVPEPAEPAVAAAAPMPDPDLSSDMAEELLDSTTEAAVGHAFARLGSLAMGDKGITIEAMIRQMLKPMLKEWLDENLPAIVERMVEREIERVSRGGR